MKLRTLFTIALTIFTFTIFGCGGRSRASSDTASSATVTVTVTNGGYVNSLLPWGFSCGSSADSGTSLCSDGSGSLLELAALNKSGGYDSDGNYDVVFNSWSGCERVIPDSYHGVTLCDLSPGQRTNVTANFTKYYGSPSSNITVTIKNSSTAIVYSPDAVGPIVYKADANGKPLSSVGGYAIYCGDGYDKCSAKVNPGLASNIRLYCYQCGIEKINSGPTGTFVLWSGCTSSDPFYCYITPGQNANVTATFK